MTDAKAKLSKRVRPGSEVAPWVFAEIICLENQLAVASIALHKLSRLGNGSLPGNSDGNKLAIQGLDAIAAEAKLLCIHGYPNCCSTYFDEKTTEYGRLREIERFATAFVDNWPHASYAELECALGDLSGSLPFGEEVRENNADFMADTVDWGETGSDDDFVGEPDPKWSPEQLARFERSPPPELKFNLVPDPSQTKFTIEEVWDALIYAKDRNG